MAGSGGAEADVSLPGWRLSLLLVGFLIASLLAESFFHWLHRVLAGRPGLGKALESLKTELLLLGLMSLALVPLTAPLSSICIPSSKPYQKDTYSPKGTGKQSPYGSRRLLSHRMQPEVLMHVGRSLFAAAGCGAPCKEGEELFWTAASIHDTHLLLFFAAFVYICYTSLTLVVCLWQVHRWKAWETELQSGPGDLRVDPRMVRMLGRSSVSHWVRATTASFSYGVTNIVYTNVRKLFLRQMRFENSYDFQNVVRISIESQLAGCFKTEWVMWLYAAVLVAIPSFALAMFWTAILSAVVMLIMGAKLTSIAIRLSVPTDSKLIEEKLEAQFAAIQAEAEGKPKLGRLSLGSLYKDTDGTATPKDTTPKARDKSVKAVELFKMGSTKAKSTLEGLNGGRPNLGQVSLGRRSMKSVTDNGSDNDGASMASSATWARPVKPNGALAGMDYKDRIQSLVYRVERQRKHLLKVQGDAKSLFWWHRPQILLRVFRFIVFQNAMNITLVGFSMLKGYKSTKDDWGLASRVPTWSLALLVIVDVCLALHAAWCVLPLYALVEMVGSHCRKRVLDKAVKGSHLQSKARRAWMLDDPDNPENIQEDTTMKDASHSSKLKIWGDNVLYQIRSPWRGSKAPDYDVSNTNVDRSGKKDKHGAGEHQQKDVLLHKLLQDIHDAAHRKKMVLLTGDGDVADNEVSDAAVSAPSGRPSLIRQSLPDLALRSIPANNVPPEVVKKLHPVLQFSIQQRASMDVQHDQGLSARAAPETALAGDARHAMAHSRSTPSLRHMHQHQEATTSTALEDDDTEFDVSHGIRAYVTASALQVQGASSSSQSALSQSSEVKVDEDLSQVEIKVLESEAAVVSGSKEV